MTGWVQDDGWEPAPEALSRAYTCEGCGQYTAPNMWINRPCPTRDCNQVVCPRCRRVWASWGPILCKSCGDMNWFWRQHHRITMWIFDRIELPIRLWWSRRKGRQ